jgi:poly(A) polymerase
MTAPETVAIFDALSANGAIARFVGGCVRDAVLGREIKDVDIATDATPETVMLLLQTAGLKAIPTGIDHGTVTAISGGKPYEVTTLRRDVETDGRRAQVVFTDNWAEDAARRDFTMNALYCDPDGTLYDPVNGLGDAHAGRVRFVGDPALRIEEDRLRILRFFRFHAWFGMGELDDQGLAAALAGAGGMSDLSAERVRVEMLRLLEAPDPLPVVRAMVTGGVLSDLLPEATQIERLARLVKIEIALDHVDPVRRLGAVLAIGGDGMVAISERLRLSNEERDRLIRVLNCSATPNPALSDPDTRRMQYALGRRLFVDAALLRWAESDADTDAPSWINYVQAAEQRLQPLFPLRGADVVAAGVAAGPEVGTLLTQVENWWIDGDFTADQSACLAELERNVEVSER